MSRRWALHEDIFIAKFYPEVGDMCGAELGRPRGAVAARVRRLKACGAWEPLQEFLKAEYTHLRAYYVALGRSAAVEMLDDIHVAAPEEE